MSNKYSYNTIATYPFVLLFLFMCLGIFFIEFLNPPSVFIRVGFILSLLLSIVLFLKNKGKFISSLFLIFFLGAMSVNYQKKDSFVLKTCEDSSQSFRGIIKKPIERSYKYHNNRLFRKTLLHIISERCGNTWQTRDIKARISLWGKPSLARGDLIELKLKFRTLKDSYNPFNISQKKLAERQGFDLYAQSLSPYSVVKYNAGLIPDIERFRDKVINRIEHSFKNKTISSLVKALGTGDRGSIDSDVKKRWSNTGIAHLLAISGLHIGTITLLIYSMIQLMVFFLPGAGERYSIRKITSLLTIPFIIIFYFWSGSSISCERATIMVVMFLLARIFSHTQFALNTLGIAGFLILLIDPLSIYDIGFILSMTAVFSLMLMPQIFKKSWISSLIFTPMWVSFIISILVSPILAYYFGRISLIAPLTNLFSVPLATLIIVPLSILYALLGEFINVIQIPLEKSLELLDYIILKINELPFITLYVSRITFLDIVLYYGIIACLLAYKKHPKIKKILYVFVLILITNTAYTKYRSYGDGFLHIYHPYVGQGDSTLIILPQGKTILFDAGGKNAYSSWDPGEHIVFPMLRYFNIKKIDIAIISHPDADHLNGFHFVSTYLPIAEIWYNGSEKNNILQKKIFDNVRNKGGKVIEIKNLPDKQNFQGVNFELIHPRPKNKKYSYYNELSKNNNSIVLKLSLGDRTFLLPGDIEDIAENMILDKNISAEIIKSPHHGSRTSSNDVFLDKVNPKSVIISCGDENKFHFPHNITLEKYKKRNIQIYRTDKHGFVGFSTKGDKWVVSTHKKHVSQ